MIDDEVFDSWYAVYTDWATLVSVEVEPHSTVQQIMAQLYIQNKTLEDDIVDMNIQIERLKKQNNLKK